MGWDIGYMGTCSGCGEHIHQFEEDRTGMTAMWLRCPRCLRADVSSVADDEKGEFWNNPHPCHVCGTERQQWESSRCPRCGKEGAGEFIYMPD